MTVLLFLLILFLFFWILGLAERLSKNEEQIKDLNFKYEGLFNRISYHKKVVKPYEKEEIIQQKEEKEDVDFVEIYEEICEKEEYEESPVKEVDEELFNGITEEKFARNDVKNSIQTKNSLESLFLGNIFNIIGGVAIIVALGIFIKTLSDYIPFLKTIVGAITGLGLIWGSYKINDEKLKMYSKIMLGTGFSVLFLTLFLTTMLFKTISIGVCASLSILLLFYAYYISHKEKSIYMIIITLIGGYLNAAMFYNMNISGLYTFAYLMFLNLASIIFVLRNYDKKIINIINLLITTIFCLINKDLSFVCPIILWSVYLFADYIMRWQNPKDYDVLGMLNWLNLGSIILLIKTIYLNSESLYPIFILIGLCIIYDLLICISIMYKKEKYEVYVYTLIITILVLAHYIPLGIIRILVLTLLSFVILFAVNKLNKKYLSSFSLIFLCASVTNIFFIKGICYSITVENYFPILNERLLLFSMPIINCLVTLYSSKNSENNKKVINIIKGLLISLISLYLIFELNALLTYLLGESSKSFNAIKWLTYSIIGFQYSLGMKRFADVEKLPVISLISNVFAGISLIILLVANVLYFANIPIFNIRLFASLIAIATVILYSKWYKNPDLNYIATIIGFLFVTMEALNLSAKINYNEPHLLSVAWILYAGILSLIGIAKKNVILKNSGIFLSLLAVFKIVINTMQYAATIQKSITFIILGIIFMIISYFYNKNKE